MAYPTLEVHIETLRDLLVGKDDELTDNEESSVMHSLRRKAKMATKDSFDVKRRADELSWLNDTMASIPSGLTQSLVAHRGTFVCQLKTHLVSMLH